MFSVLDRQNVLDYIVSVSLECDKIVALVQVGSGAVGYNDDWSDLDFVIALDAKDSKAEAMNYMQQRISEKYKTSYFFQHDERNLQCYVLSNLLEIDLGYGPYDRAAALKPEFSVLFDKTGTVKEKMDKSREGLGDRIYGEKHKKDIEQAYKEVWIRMMHAAVAIHRYNFFRAVGEIEYIRKTYIELIGDRFRLESNINREIDKLPEEEKAEIKETYITGESAAVLWGSLLKLTELIYNELKGFKVPVSQEMIKSYYEGSCEVVQPYSHFIQYLSGSEPYESGTSLVQRKSKAGEAPFSAALRNP